MLFDPILSRHNAMIDFLVNMEYDPNLNMGAMSEASINMMISDWIVGLKQETEVILPSRIAWLQEAIDNKETLKMMSMAFRQYCMYESLALAKWLHTGTDSLTDWEQARRWYADYYVDELWCQKNQLKTCCLDDYMGLCIQSQAYQAGIDEFERYYGNKNISINRKTITPREYGYLVCQNKINPQYDNTTMLELGKKLLTKHLESDWLGYGQYDRATIWLKVVYENYHAPLSPEQVLLRAYDNMPNVEKPSFITDI